MPDIIEFVNLPQRYYMLLMYKNRLSYGQDVCMSSIYPNDKNKLYSCDVDTVVKINVLWVSTIWFWLQIFSIKVFFCNRQYMVTLTLTPYWYCFSFHYQKSRTSRSMLEISNKTKIGYNHVCEDSGLVILLHCSA